MYRITRIVSEKALVSDTTVTFSNSYDLVSTASPGTQYPSTVDRMAFYSGLRNYEKNLYANNIKLVRMRAYNLDAQVLPQVLEPYEVNELDVLGVRGVTGEWAGAKFAAYVKQTDGQGLRGGRLMYRGSLFETDVQATGRTYAFQGVAMLTALGRFSLTECLGPYLSAGGSGATMVNLHYRTVAGVKAFTVASPVTSFVPKNPTTVRVR